MSLIRPSLVRKSARGDSCTLSSGQRRRQFCYIFIEILGDLVVKEVERTSPIRHAGIPPFESIRAFDRGLPHWVYTLDYTGNSAWLVRRYSGTFTTPALFRPITANY